MWQAIAKVATSALSKEALKTAGKKVARQAATNALKNVATKGRQDAQSRQGSRAGGLQFLDTNVSNWTD